LAFSSENLLIGFCFSVSWIVSFSSS